jgi:Cu(I)/Ag(I) efflux system membrane protein CusA/SilA
MERSSPNFKKSANCRRKEAWGSGIGSDVIKPIAAPIVGGMITSSMHVLILVPVFFAFMKERALRRGTLCSSRAAGAE